MNFGRFGLCQVNKKEASLLYHWSLSKCLFTPTYSDNSGESPYLCKTSALLVPLFEVKLFLLFLKCVFFYEPEKICVCRCFSTAYISFLSRVGNNDSRLCRCGAQRQQTVPLCVPPVARNKNIPIPLISATRTWLMQDGAVLSPWQRVKI